MYEKFYIGEKKLLARNSRRKFLKNLLKNAKKKYKPNHRDLSRNWIAIEKLCSFLLQILFRIKFDNTYIKK